MKEKETVLRYYNLDSHTEVFNEGLTLEEKQDLGIHDNLFAEFNEIGFSTPINSNAWKEDCFNVTISDNEEFDNPEVLLFPISRLPKRFEETYMGLLKEREKYSS